MIIRVTRKFNFEMAHALHGHDGPCKNIHGHSYSLLVTVTGKINQQKKSSKLGMVIDFSDLKKIVEENIIREFDHSLTIRKNTIPAKGLSNGNFEKINFTSYQPTCENLLIDFSIRIKNKLPQGIKLHHLKLRETPNSFAEFYEADNN